MKRPIISQEVYKGATARSVYYLYRLLIQWRGSGCYAPQLILSHRNRVTRQFLERHICRRRVYRQPRFHSPLKHADTIHAIAGDTTHLEAFKQYRSNALSFARKELPISLTKRILRDILRRLAALHDQNIVHTAKPGRHLLCVNHLGSN